MASARENGISRLPTLIEAADKSGVSHITMMKAVHELRDQGIVSVRQRGGIHIHDGPAVAVSRTMHGKPQPSIPKWTEVASKVRTDIESGLYLPDSLLPLGKTLSQRYGTSAETLRSALRSLSEEGVLTRHKRGYRVFQAHVRETNHSVVLVARGMSSVQMMDLPQMTYLNLRALEQECRRAQLGLHTVPCYYINEDIVGEERLRDLISRRETSDRIIGIMVWSLSLSPAFCAKLTPLLERSGKPCSVFIEPDSQKWEAITGNPLVRFFRMENSRMAGRMMGQYLFSLGHRRIAYIHVAGNHDYTVQRLEGLQDVFGKNDLTSPEPNQGITVIMPEEFPEQSGSSGVNVYPVGGNHPEINVERYAAAYEYLMNTQSMIDRVEPWRMYRTSLFGKLREVVRNRSITAWVCANDTTAIDCLDFARAENIRIPGELSIAGFDNSENASFYGLTSYEFNGPAYIHMMTDFLLRPTWRTWERKTEGPIEIEGYVVARQTTGKVGK